MGIRDRPISPSSPWQNGYAERLIGTVRRECLDRMLIFGEAYLRRILSLYAIYYNESRTHLPERAIRLPRNALGSTGPTLQAR
jgi:transposase InsO family protein